MRPTDRVPPSAPARERARAPESGERLDTQGLDTQGNYLGRRGAESRKQERERGDTEGEVLHFCGWERLQIPL